MSWSQKSGTLGALADYVRGKVGQTGTRRVVIVRLSGTFVGTVTVNSESAAGVLSSETVSDAEDGTTGSPTTVGVYTALLDANSVAWRVVCSAYTSGTIRVETREIPQSA